MHIFECLHFLKEINYLLFTNLATCVICFEYRFRTVLLRSLRSESIKIILFTTSHLRLQLRLRRNYFLGLRKRLRRNFYDLRCQPLVSVMSYNGSNSNGPRNCH